MPYFFHKILGKRLTSLDDRGIRARSEGGNTDLLKSVNTAKNERIVGANYGEVDLVGLRKLYDTVNIGRLDGMTFGKRRHSAVTGKCVNFICKRTFRDLLQNRVLSSARADQKNIHVILFLFLNFVGR